MTIRELEQSLHYHQIPEQWYCLNGIAEGAYGIAWESGRWLVFSGERGGKTVLEVFENENDACEYLDGFLQRKLDRAIKAQRRRKK